MSKDTWLSKERRDLRSVAFAISLIVGVLLFSSKAKADFSGEMQLNVKVTEYVLACWTQADATEVVDLFTTNIGEAFALFFKYTYTSSPRRCDIGRVSYTPHEVVGSGIDVDGNAWIIVISTAHSLRDYDTIYIMTLKEVIIKTQLSELELGEPFSVKSWWACFSKQDIDDILEARQTGGHIAASDRLTVLLEQQKCLSISGSMTLKEKFQEVDLAKPDGETVHVTVVRFRSAADIELDLYTYTILKIKKVIEGIDT